MATMLLQAWAGSASVATSKPKADRAELEAHAAAAAGLDRSWATVAMLTAVAVQASAVMAMLWVMAGGVLMDRITTIPHWVD